MLGHDLFLGSLDRDGKTDLGGVLVEKVSNLEEECEV